ncbi:SEC-C metal-binding domain-containing protein [Rhizosphaericola mali]|uniref:SEC-C domain-containing protein n=1 Tax=Rhizosphaericola mali TaxID=2545455 RepID=A0A5P2G0Y5_9BACT|nr:SEC-C metal-binding domain-containing protein [Rhizosphaericola mali]QES88847.1 SEC-C domain-containing protein [Rhizosphaericola mali]
MKKLNKMTPQKITFTVTKFIDSLNATHEPILLDVEAEEGAEERDCFPVVQKKVEKEGGRMIMGWQIWQFKDLYIEAECHAVWEDKNEDLHDITPKPESVKKILFVEDSNLIYDDKQIENIILNTSNNKLVDDLIEVSHAIFKFDNKGIRAETYNLSDILNSEQVDYKTYLWTMREMITSILQNKGSRNSKCPCNSGKKFIECHRKGFETKIKLDL